MQFNSYSYLLLLMLAVAMFWTLPITWRRWYVLTVSLLFYATWNPLFVLLPIAICCSTYLCARLMQADTARPRTAPVVPARPAPGPRGGFDPAPPARADLAASPG